MRMEPPPSLPCATATMPDATAAAEPPLEPPAERPRLHGLRVGPWLRTASVVGAMQSSGTLVRANAINPAWSKRAVSVASRAKRISSNS